MACPRCGSSAPAIRGRCSACGLPLAAASDAPTGSLLPPDGAQAADAEAPTGHGTAANAEAPTAAAGLGAVASELPTGAAAIGGLTSELPTVTGRLRASAPDAPTGTAGAVRPPPRGGGPLIIGHDFGSRYHIIRLLGIGGMGAVYQAWDKVLEVAVAVKVIRPPDTEDEDAAQTLERRFKRELLLARQVTHKHVVRIHDLGEIDGITYITMPYIQGANLASVLKKEGRMPVERTVSIVRQIASGLGAAHEAGVVHRDLKPANIMIEAEGNALIMDFGIARSTSGVTGPSMTAGGAIVGTIEYMAPEQASGVPVDHRADIYSLGLILNDLLLGRRQGNTSTAVAELMARIKDPPAPIRSVDPTLPAPLEAIVTKCLQPNPAARYQHIGELLLDLGAGDSSTAHTPIVSSSASMPVVVEAPVRSRAWIGWVAAAVVVAALAGAAWAWRGALFGRPGPAAPAGPIVSLAILPFRNASADPTLDSIGMSLSQVLGSELGQSSRVRTVPADRLLQVLKDLQISSNVTLAPAELTRVADFTNARRVLWGQISRFGNSIRIDATLQDLDRNVSVPLTATAPNEASFLTAMSTLAESVRQELARGTPDILAELKATAWKPSTSSFEAMRLYTEGMQLTQQGTFQEARKRFEAATKQDGNFALAYSALGRAYSSLGYDDEAMQASRRAMSLADALPSQEKYLIAANHYQIANDTDKAIEAYENLVKASPNSAVGQFDLGTLYEQSGNFDKAREHFSKVIELDPKFVQGLLAMGRIEIRRGYPQESLAHLNGALTLAIQLNNNEARANVLQAIGVAYKRIDRPEEALRHFEQSLALKRPLNDKRGMASSLGEIGQIQDRLGKPREAEASFREALKLQREIGNKSGMSISLISLASLYNETLGRPDDALPLLREALQLRRDTGNRPGEALVLNNIGNVYLAKGDLPDAQTNFERALEIREKANVPGDLADTLHNLGETLAKMGRYDQALPRYHRALELRRGAGDKRGVAIESYGIGTIFDAQGRYGAAAKSKDEALQAYRDVKQRDVWLAELLSGAGYSLSLAGRLNDASQRLDEALALARELQNANLIAQTLTFQAERLYFAGDVKGAAALADQAALASAKAPDRSLALLAQTSVARAALAVQPTKALAARLATLAQDADKAGLRSLAVECSILRAETLIKLGDRPAASQEVDRALAKADTLGFRLSQAKGHYLRGELLRAAQDAEARREYAQALRIMNEIRGEEGSQGVLKRSDLAAVYAECERFAKAG